jgi:hypothetical protein
MPHVPDTVPGKRVTDAGARTEGREARRQTSEVGAVCGKAARTVLCGGRPVMGVPTAIAFLSPRSSSVFSIPRSRSAEGTDAESGTEAISLKRKESGGSRSLSAAHDPKLVAFLFTHLLSRAM